MGGLPLILQVLSLIVDIGILLILVVEYNFDKIVYEKERYKHRTRKPKIIYEKEMD